MDFGPFGPFISVKLIQTKSTQGQEVHLEGEGEEKELEQRRAKEKSPLSTNLVPVCEEGKNLHSPTAITIAHEN